MCNQSVGLISSVIEKSGIPTAGISLLRGVTEKVNPPRSLWVPFPMGHPLGRPREPALQHRVIGAVLALLESPAALPLRADWAP